MSNSTHPNQASLKKDDGLSPIVPRSKGSSCGFGQSMKRHCSPTALPQSSIVKEEDSDSFSGFDQLRRKFAETEVLRAQNKDYKRQRTDHGNHTRSDYKSKRQPDFNDSGIGSGIGSSIEPEGLFFREASYHKHSSPTISTGAPSVSEEGEVREESPEPSESDDATEIRNLCRCPVNLDCPAKDNNKLDCRTLVLEWSRWVIKQDGQARIISIQDTTDEFEAFATLAEASEITRHCNNFQLRPAFSSSLRYTLGKMRDWANKMLERSITSTILCQSNALPALQGFLCVANMPNRISKHVPLGTVDDLRIVYNKWMSGDLSILPRRGLRHERNGWVPDKNWPWHKSHKYFGHGHLVLGQIWFSRAALLRDGGHGAIIAGIAGSKKQGATSIVMGYHNNTKKEYYGDVDMGNKIYYMGTALHPETEDDLRTNISDRPDERVDIDPDDPHASKSTVVLFKSLENGKPVRVFRSFKLAEIVKHRPDKGFRYDGLYRVVRYELMKAKRQIYRFEMDRLTDTVGPYAQGPIRANVQVDNINGRRKRKSRS